MAAQRAGRSGKPQADGRGDTGSARLLSHAFRGALTSSRLTLSSLAREIGVNRPTLAAWLKNNSYPPEQIERIASALSIGGSLGELRKRYSFGTTNWSWAGRSRGPERGMTESDVVSAMLETAKKDDRFVQIFCDGLPQVWTAVFAGRVQDRSVQALKLALAHGVGVHFIAPSERLRRQWERTFGIGAPPVLAEVCQSWMQRLSLNEAQQVKLRQLEASPLFLPGVSIVAVAGSGPRPTLVEAKLLVAAGAAPDEPTVSSLELPPTLRQGLMELLGQTSDL